MANSSRKCLCNVEHHQQEGTCLSDLPDAMLLEILSHLPTVEAIKTSVLSKRWRYLWTSVPVLRFIMPEPYFSSAKTYEIILKQIHFALIFNRSKNLSRFIVSCPAIPYHPSEIYLWCRVAVERQADELRLEISGPRYPLPSSLCHHRSLKSLIMWECCMELPRDSINWPLLRNLELHGSVLADGFYEAIILGCPLLESIVLKRVSGTAGTSLITAPRLRKLSLIDSLVQFKISAPNLESLKISCNHNYFEHTIEDVHSLVSVSFIIKMDRSAGYPRGWGISCGKHLSILLHNAWRARFLTICSCCIQIFSARELFCQEPYSLDARYLVLKTSFFDSEIPGLQNLLTSSPYLETIYVMIRYRHPCSMKGVVKVGSSFDGSRYMAPRSSQFLHLRDVQIQGIVDISVIAQYGFNEICEWNNILDAQSSIKSRQKIEKKISIACSKLRKPVVHVLRFIKFLLGSSAGLNSIMIWLPSGLLFPQHSEYNDNIKNIIFWNCSSTGAADPRIRFAYEQVKHLPMKVRGFRHTISST